MAENYVVLFKDSTQTSLADSDIVTIEVRITTPIGGFALGEPWVFFYKIAVPVTWDDVVWSGRLADVKAWRHQY